MRRKKTKYLNRTIWVITMLGYMGLLILLLVSDTYLILEKNNNHLKHEEETLEQYITEIADAMEDVENLIYDIYFSDENFEKLSRKQSEIEEYGNAYELQQTFRQKMMMDEKLHGFYIFYGSKCWYNVNTDYIEPEKAPILKKVLKELNSNGNAPSGYQRSWTTVLADEEVCLALKCRKDNVAVFAVYNLGKVEKKLQESMEETFDISIIDKGVILQNHKLAKELELIQKTKIYENKFILSESKTRIIGRRIDNTDIWICLTHPVTLWDFVNVPLIILLVITLLSALAVGALFFFIRKNLLTPVRQLGEIMEKIGKGEQENVPEIETKFYEIQKTYETLNSMTKALKEQQVRLAEEAVEREKAQMQYLQLQLKPHFYLNGLKTLNALAMANKTDKIQELVVNLSEHIRYLLQLDHETVRLQEEVRFVENYVKLQKHVTGRIVHCHITMEAEIESVQVPVLCIQTFVENSIKYAKLGSVQVPLEIEITLGVLEAEEGDFVDIVVTDNGQGYSEEVLENINSDIITTNSNIGINNIKRRCRILYGDKAEYYFDTIPGAMSELILPKEEVKR